MSDEEKAYDALRFVRNGNVAGVEQLLRANPNIARVKVAGCMGATLLQYAVSDGHMSVVKTLLEFGADPAAQDDRGFSALHAAAYCGRAGVLELLLVHAERSDVRDVDGMLPIHFAAFEGYTETVKLLLMQPLSDVNVRDASRKTPLHYSAARCKTDTIKLLLEHGADVNAFADDGGTPLDWAWFRRDNKQTITLIQSFGGKRKEDMSRSLELDEVSPGTVPQADFELIDGIIRTLGLAYSDAVSIAESIRSDFQRLLPLSMNAESFVEILEGRTRPSSDQKAAIDHLLNKLFESVLASLSRMQVQIWPGKSSWRDCVLGLICFAVSGELQGFGFYVNSRKSEARVIAGPKPDLEVFLRAKERSQGECIVIFSVGNQKVSNRVVFSKSSIRVENGFVHYDVEKFIHQERERIKEEQRDAHFVDTLDDIYFVSSARLLSCGRTLPSFDRTQLVIGPPGKKYFVSHRWLSSTHPDPDGEHLQILKRHARSNPDAFYWIDYSCLPQSRNSTDTDLFNKTLPKIASIQSKSSTLVIMAPDYDERLWCYMEHYAGVLFSQTNLDTIGQTPRKIEYLGSGNVNPSILENVQDLLEPEWNNFKVTKSSDIPGIQYNYKWLSNLVRFALHDRFTELRTALPGHEVYSGLHYPQSAFGIKYTPSLEALRSLFVKLNGDIKSFYQFNSLLWLSQRLERSELLDEYEIDELHFSQALFATPEMVGWMAMLLAVIKLENMGQTTITHQRDLLSKIVLMSLFR